MNYTHSNLVGQGIAIGSNFYVIRNVSFANDNVSINNDESEIGYASINSHLTSLTKDIVGTQLIEDNTITFSISTQPMFGSVNI
jgi:hypothetical protein